MSPPGTHAIKERSEKENKRDIDSHPLMNFRGNCLRLVPLALALGAVSSNLSLAAGQAVQEQHGEYRYQATAVDTPPTVDGDLSDPVWQKAAVIDQFIQIVPDSGKPATERTEVRIVYDSDTLYIAAYVHYTDPTAVVRNVLRFRDDQVWAKDDIMRFFLILFTITVALTCSRACTTLTSKLTH